MISADDLALPIKVDARKRNEAIQVDANAHQAAAAADQAALMMMKDPCECADHNTHKQTKFECKTLVSLKRSPV